MNNEKMFFTIGEVEKIIGIKQHVIRFLEKKIPSIIPKRHNGRRLYTKETIQKIRNEIERMTEKTNNKNQKIKKKEKKKNQTQISQKKFSTQDIKTIEDTIQSLKTLSFDIQKELESLKK